MKILIVEDHFSSRVLLRKILRKAEYEVLEAKDGKEAYALLEKNEIDAVVTDWMMPNLDGLELISLIRKKKEPAPALIVITALVSDEARLRALESGADEYIAKPIEKDRVLERLQNVLNRKKLQQSQNLPKTNRKDRPNFVAVCIAASTGGPPTLSEIFRNIEETKDAAFFIVLHGPDWMLESFTDKLRKISKLNVDLAKTDMEIAPGRIYVCPGSYHMIINPTKMLIELSDAPPINFIKPAADPLFQSIASVFKSNAIGVVLTGMGRDGSIGSGFISAAGGDVIAQEPSTAILSSMPQSVIDLRIAKKVIPLNKIAKTINSEIRNKINSN